MPAKRSPRPAPRRPSKERVPVPIRITLLSPPSGVAFCVQERDHLPSGPKISTGADLSFDVTIQAERVGGAPRFFGEVTQGPPSSRFVYLCVGTLAGQADSLWTRRVKIPLGGISWSAIESISKGRVGRLEASYEATANDGGPTCATVKLRGPWKAITTLPAAMTGRASPAKAAEGDKPVFAYIASLPQPQRSIAERVDALAAKTLPKLQRSVKWGIAWYGVGDGWCFCCGGFEGHVKLTFGRGTSLKPVPPVTPVGMGKDSRGVDLATLSDLDEGRVASWMKQATAIPGFGGKMR